MKKLLITVLGALCALSLGAAVFAGCGDRGDGGNSGNGGGNEKDFTITVENGEGYTAKADKTSADMGETVTITVTVTDPDMYIQRVLANSNELDENSDGKYTATVTTNLTIKVEMGTYTEVTEDGALTYNGMNTIAQNSTYPYSFYDEHIWKLNVVIDSDRYMFLSLSNRSYVKSSNQEVIPDEAIMDFDKVTNEDLFGSSGSSVIEQVNAQIDTTKINKGTTWLTIYLRADAGTSGADGTIVVKVTVVGRGEIEIETAKKTVVIDVDGLSASEGDSYTLHFADDDYIDGGNQEHYFDITATVEGGKLTFEFDYAIGHHYNITLSSGETYDFDKRVSLSNKVIGSGIYNENAYDGYSEDGLMFTTIDSIELEASPLESN